MNDSITPTDAELIGDHCFVCKSTEAWHGCITEDGSTKFACDECGVSTSTIVDAPKPKPAKAKRPFNFTFEIDKGRLFIDWCDRAILAFKPGRYLAIGDNWELMSAAEAEAREEQATMVGRMVEQRLSEEAAA